MNGHRSGITLSAGWAVAGVTNKLLSGDRLFRSAIVTVIVFISIAHKQILSHLIESHHECGFDGGHPAGCSSPALPALEALSAAKAQALNRDGHLSELLNHS